MNSSEFIDQLVTRLLHIENLATRKKSLDEFIKTLTNDEAKLLRDRLSISEKSRNPSSFENYLQYIYQYCQRDIIHDEDNSLYSSDYTPVFINVPVEIQEHLSTAIKAIRDNERLVMLDGSGAGKSSTIQYVALQLARYHLNESDNWLLSLAQQYDSVSIPEEESFWSDYIPLFIKLDYAAELWHRARRKDPLRVLLNARKQDLNGNDNENRELNSARNLDKRLDELKAKIQSGFKVLALLDGLDTVPKRYRSDVFQFIKIAVEQLTPFRWVVTSRSDTFQQLMSDNRLELPGFQTAVLQSLDSQSVQRYIDLWKEKLHNKPLQSQALQLLNNYLDDDRIAKIITNPMMLSLITNISINNKDFFISFRSITRPRIYAQFIERKFKYDIERQYRLMEGSSNSIQLLITQSDLTNCFEELAFQIIERRHRDSSYKDIFIAESEAKSIALKLIGSQKTNMLLDFACNNQYLFKFDTIQGEPLLEFVHDGFREYFAAIYMSKNREKWEELFTGNRVVNWTSVLELIVEQGDKTGIADVISHFLKAATPQPQSDFVVGYPQMLLTGVHLLYHAATTLWYNQPDEFLQSPVITAALKQFIVIFENLQALEKETKEEKRRFPQLRIQIGQQLSRLIAHLGYNNLDANKISYRPHYTTKLPNSWCQLPNKPKDWILEHPITNIQFNYFIQDGYVDFVKRTLKKHSLDPHTIEVLCQNWKDLRQAWGEATQLPDYPAAVSWYEAVAYCEWYNEQKKSNRLKCRLPTSKEWDEISSSFYPVEQLNYMNWNNRSFNFGSASPVGLFPFSALVLSQENMLHQGDISQLYDVFGNVWEWCVGGEYQLRQPLRGGSYTTPHSLQLYITDEFSSILRRDYGFRPMLIDESEDSN